MLSLLAFLAGLLASYLIYRFKRLPPRKSQPPRPDFQARCALAKPRRMPDSEHRFVTGIRTDIKLTHSKIAEIQSRVVVDAVTAQLPGNAQLIAEWFYLGQAQICTKVASAAQMQELIATAERGGVPFATVRADDGEVLAIGVGPGRAEVVNQVTRALKLL
jgi:peptidyl-tRNA hydrolase